MSKIRNKILNNFLNQHNIIDTILTESYIPLSEEDKKNIEIEQGLEKSDEINEIIHKFMDFLKEQLQLETLPKISLLLNRKENMTYGVYNPNNNVIYVYAKNRGLADILRTAAHELVHHWQKLNNKIPKDLNGRNLELEGEANTKAGDFIYMFGLKEPNIYEIDIKPENIV
jgi:Zn-dependent peptidase ImmA (M78 family)